MTGRLGSAAYSASPVFHFFPSSLNTAANSALPVFISVNLCGLCEMFSADGTG